MQKMENQGFEEGVEDLDGEGEKKISSMGKIDREIHNSVFIFRFSFPQISENSVGLLLMVPVLFFLLISQYWFASSEVDTKTEFSVQGLFFKGNTCVTENGEKPRKAIGHHTSLTPK